MSLLGTLLAVAPMTAAAILAGREARQERARRMIAERRAEKAEADLAESIVARTRLVTEWRQASERNLATFAALRAQLADLRAASERTTAALPAATPRGGLVS